MTIGCMLQFDDFVDLNSEKVASIKDIRFGIKFFTGGKTESPT
ncbi:hypothetical protein AA105894_1318 [Asaia spathodeae NBRC 105894]|nr:hypothetical protein AA105894_1318 [Asaia spathodeae NBRC 105894]